MIRPIAVLLSAMLLSRPSMPRAEGLHYAKVLNEVAARYDFDPLTAVAIIHFETSWNPHLVSPDGEDYGLGQIRARYAGACRDDEDPLNSPSESCKAQKAALLDGAYNIRRMATLIAANRDLCRNKTGTAKAFQWLAGYQGLNYPQTDRWCQPGPKTWRVLEYREKLIAKLLPKPAPKRITGTKPSTSVLAKRTTK